MTLIDSHCHLDFPDFADEIEAVVARAAERRRRADGDDLDPRRARRGASPRSPSASRRSISPSAPIRITPPRSLETDAGAIRAFAAHPKCVGIGESRARLPLQLRAGRTSPRRSFAPRSRSRANSSCRSSSTRARPTTTSPRSCARKWREGAFNGGAALLHLVARARRDRPGARPLHVVFRRADVQELRRIARAGARRSARPAARRDRRAVSRARSPSRPAQRAGVRRRDGARSRRPQAESTKPRSPPRRAPTRCGCSPRWRRSGSAALEPVADHIGLRIVGRRAARRARLGRLRSRQSAQPSPAMFGAGRARGAGGANLGADRRRARTCGCN